IQEYVSDFPKKPWTLTVKHLLAHLGGIRHYQSDEERFNLKHFRTLRESVAVFENDELLAEPGSVFSYSTHAYNLLGCAIENASGMEFTEYLTSRIFLPAEMTQTSAWETGGMFSRQTRGYRRTNDGELVDAPLIETSNRIPGGGLRSTSIDMARFGLAVLTYK